MKKYNLILLSVACVVGCSTQDAPRGISCQSVAVLVDFTDVRSLWFRPTPCLSLYNFTANPQSEGWFHLTEISDKRINEDYTVHLPTTQVTEKDNDEFPQHRNYCILSFYDSVRRACTDMYSKFDTTQTKGHSEIFAAICQELNWLLNKHSAAYLLVFSNLIEKSAVADAYNVSSGTSATELTDRFEASNLIPRHLSGITVFFINAPLNRVEDCRYSVLLSVYRKMIEERGGKVIVQANNQNYIQ